MSTQPEREAIVSVAIDNLHTDAYQRWDEHYTPTGLRVAKANAENYNPLLDEVITVSVRPDGSMWIVDGRHRVEMHRFRGQTSVSARLLYGLSYQEEARLYTDMNGKTKKAVTPIQRFRGAVEAGDPASVEISSAVKAADLNVNSNLRCVGALYEVHGRWGVEVLQDTLYLLKAVIPQGERVQKWILIPTALVIDERITNSQQFSQLEEKMYKHYREIERERLGSPAAHAHGGGILEYKPIANIIIHYYNRNRRAENKLAPIP